MRTLSSLPLLSLLAAHAAPAAPAPPPIMVISPPPPRIMIAPPPAPPPPPVDIVRPPEAIGRERWITSEDYPVAARRDAAEGRTSVSYEVRADGRVGWCAVTASSGNAALDEATCALLRARARFRPARNAAGRAVPHVVRQAILWQLPEEAEPAPLVPGQVVVRLPVRRDGLLSCERRASRPELEMLADDLCAALYPDDAETARPIRIVASVGVGNAPPPASPASSAAAIWSQDLRFDVGSDGRVRRCVATTAPQSVAVNGFEGCEFLEADGEAYFEAAAQGADPRQARLRVEIYELPPQAPR